MPGAVVSPAGKLDRLERYQSGPVCGRTGRFCLAKVHPAGVSINGIAA